MHRGRSYDCLICQHGPCRNLRDPGEWTHIPKFRSSGILHLRCHDELVWVDKYICSSTESDHQFNKYVFNLEWSKSIFINMKYTNKSFYVKPLLEWLFIAKQNKKLFLLLLYHQNVQFHLSKFDNLHALFLPKQWRHFHLQYF